MKIAPPVQLIGILAESTVKGSMAVFRVDVLVNDPQSVFDWIHEHVPQELLVRVMGYETFNGWYVKAVFKRQSDAESFHRQWYPDAEEHTVKPF